MRRRDVIAGLSGTAAWPSLALGSSQGPATSRGSCWSTAKIIPTAPMIVATLRESLQRAGWTWGQNLAVDLHYGNGDAERMRPPGRTRSWRS